MTNFEYIMNIFKHISEHNLYHHFADFLVVKIDDYIELKE